MKLYEIVEQHRQLLDLIKEGEIPEEAIADTLECIEGELTAKAESIICIIKELQAEETALKVEAAALENRATQKRKSADRMKQYLLKNMQAVNVDKIETPKCYVKVAATPGKVVIDDTQELYRLRPDLFTTKEPEPSKAAIAALLKAGEEVAGCRLETGYRLAVK